MLMSFGKNFGLCKRRKMNDMEYNMNYGIEYIIPAFQSANRLACI